MVKLAANLTMMFTELPFLDRFAAAADSRFRAVEFALPYDVAAEQVAAKAQNRDLEIVLFNMPAGNWAAGERGIGCDPSRIGEFRAGVDKALEYARVLNCSRLHLMAGKLGNHDRDIARKTLVDNVIYAADLLAHEGLEVLLEPINTRVDIPGYFYDTTDAAMGVIHAAGRPNVKLLYDIYHMQIMEGDLARRIERLLPTIGHMQLADNPGRHEPGTGEINYPWLLKRVDASGYRGAIGCEYHPAAGTLAGIGWAKPYLD